MSDELDMPVVDDLGPDEFSYLSDAGHKSGEKNPYVMPRNIFTAASILTPVAYATALMLNKDATWADAAASWGASFLTTSLSMKLQRAYTEAARDNNGAEVGQSLTTIVYGEKRSSLITLGFTAAATALGIATQHAIFSMAPTP